MLVMIHVCILHFTRDYTNILQENCDELDVVSLQIYYGIYALKYKNTAWFNTLLQK